MMGTKTIIHIAIRKIQHIHLGGEVKPLGLEKMYLVGTPVMYCCMRPPRSGGLPFIDLDIGGGQGGPQVLQVSVTCFKKLGLLARLPLAQFRFPAEGVSRWCGSGRRRRRAAGNSIVAAGGRLTAKRGGHTGFCHTTKTFHDSTVGGLSSGQGRPLAVAGLRISLRCEACAMRRPPVRNEHADEGGNRHTCFGLATQILDPIV